MRTVLLAMVLLAGCTPAIRGDGFYRCERSEDCPRTAPLCLADQRCHSIDVRLDAALADAGSADDDAGHDPEVDAGLAPDAGTDAGRDAGAPSYPRCGAGLPPCPSEGTCLGTLPGTPGWCSTSCATNEACGDGLCVAGLCRAPCTGAAECGTHECLSATAGGMRRNVCLDGTFAIAAPHFMPCTDGACAAPFACIGGTCLRDCAEGGLCRAPEACVPAPMAARACLPTCTGSCPGGATCTTTPGETRTSCVPSTWPAP